MLNCNPIERGTGELLAPTRNSKNAQRRSYVATATPRGSLRGIWVGRADDVPNCQVLERVPIRRAIPGSIEQVEYDLSKRPWM